MQIDNTILEQLLEAANDRVLSDPSWARGVQHAVRTIIKYSSPRDSDRNTPRDDYKPSGSLEDMARDT